MLGSFVKFSLLCGIEAAETMPTEKAGELAGERYGRNPEKPGCRLRIARSRFDIHGGNVSINRPRVRDNVASKEMQLSAREHFSNGDLLQNWASTRC